jgi:hypothetical protein
MFDFVIVQRFQRFRLCQGEVDSHLSTRVRATVLFRINKLGFYNKSILLFTFIFIVNS